MEPDSPKLSIALTTYNHENYIRDCLNSILNQNINCAFEIVIGEDASKDKTRSIILSFMHQHYDKIRLIPLERNLGYTKNFDAVLKLCRGEYISIFDGDDIMLQGKLQKQIDFLDENPSLVMVTHDALEFDDYSNKTLRIIKPKRKKDFYTIKDLLLLGSIFCNSSKMFRRKDLPSYGIDHNINYIADMYLTFHIVREGKIGYIPEILAKYRRHKGALMFSVNGAKNYDDEIRTLESIDNLYGNKYKSLYYNRISYANMILGMYFVHQNNLNSARRKLLISIRKSPFRARSQYLYLLMTFLPVFLRTILIRLKE